MISRQLCSIALLIQGASAGFGFGSCQKQPECKPQDSYTELGRVLGSWYVVDPDLMESLGTVSLECNLYSYELTGSTYTEAQITTVMDVPVSNDAVEFDDATLRAKIVRTDYDNFAVRYECEDYLGGLMHTKKAALLSRTKELDDAYWDQAVAFLKEECSYDGLIALKQWGIGCSLDKTETKPKPKTPPSPTTCRDDPSSWDTSTSVPSPVPSVEPTLEDGSLKVQWTKPSESETAIRRYQIEFKDKDGAFRELKSCLGCWSKVKTGLSCSIPLPRFFEGPLNLEEGSKIEVRVKALNAGGYSEPTLNTGTLILPPRVPSRPTKVKVFGTASKVFIEWQPPVQRGFSDVTKYIIKSTACGNSGDLAADSRSFTIESLPLDKLCDIAVIASNSMGEGRAKMMEVRASSSPGNLSPASSSIVVENGEVKFLISWPDPGSQQELTKFEVIFKENGTDSIVKLAQCEVVRSNGELPSSCLVPKSELESKNLVTASGNERSATLSVQAYTSTSQFESSPQASILLWKEEVPSQWTTVSSFSGTMASMSLSCQHHETSGIIVTHYELYMTRYELASFTSADRIQNSTTSTFSVPALSSGRMASYRFTCIAINAWGRGPINNGIGIHIHNSTSPSFAQSLKISSLTTTTATATWNLPSENASGIAGLNIELYQVGSRQLVTSARPALESPRVYEMDSLAPGTEYFLLIEYEGSGFGETEVWFKTLSV